MLGDTAIAVLSKDSRYSHLHGKYAIHPFNSRKIPIIIDDILVDPSFGTGAVKITPAHDPNDFEVGKRHKLEFINIFTDDGKINSNGGPEFEGMPRFKASVVVLEALHAKKLYRGAQKNEMNLGFCSRSNDVVEPMVKPQWFVNCSSMAKEALDAAVGSEKKIEIIPEQYEAEWKRCFLTAQLLTHVLAAQGILQFIIYCAATTPSLIFESSKYYEFVKERALDGRVGR